MNPIDAFLLRHKRIALDTSVFIYSIEKNPKYLALSDRVMAWVEQPGHTAVTSTIAMTEILVKPYLILDDEGVRRVYRLLSSYPNLEWIAPHLDVADIAARLRARYRLKTADALQAATSVHARATGLVTNDSDFERVPEFETLILDRLL